MSTSRVLRFLALAAMSLVLVFIVTGCGDDDEPELTPTDPIEVEDDDGSDDGGTDDDSGEDGSGEDGSDDGEDGGSGDDADADLPPIVVDAPEPGSSVPNPVTISGTANVFEANVSIEIRDASGKRIVRTFTTATCGSGCRGDFTETVDYEVDEAQMGKIIVFESSAKDGSKLHTVKVPVELTP